MTVKLSNGDMNLDRGEFKDFEATLGDGELEIEDIRTGSLKLKNSNGDVMLKRAVLGDGEISLGDGELQIRDSSFNGDMDISSSDGDVSIEMKAGSVKKPTYIWRPQMAMWMLPAYQKAEAVRGIPTLSTRIKWILPHRL